MSVPAKLRKQHDRTYATWEEAQLDGCCVCGGAISNDLIVLGGPYSESWLAMHGNCFARHYGPRRST